LGRSGDRIELRAPPFREKFFIFLPADAGSGSFPFSSNRCYPIPPNTSLLLPPSPLLEKRIPPDEETALSSPKRSYDLRFFLFFFFFFPNPCGNNKDVLSPRCQRPPPYLTGGFLFSFFPPGKKKACVPSETMDLPFPQATKGRPLFSPHRRRERGGRRLPLFVCPRDSFFFLLRLRSGYVHFSFLFSLFSGRSGSLSKRISFFLSFLRFNGKWGGKTFPFFSFDADALLCWERTTLPPRCSNSHSPPLLPAGVPLVIFSSRKINRFRPFPLPDRRLSPLRFRFFPSSFLIFQGIGPTDPSLPCACRQPRD